MIAEEKKQLEKIEDENNRELAKKALQFLSTHPASEERIQKLNALNANANNTNNTNANPSSEYRNLSAEFAELQTAVKQFVTETQGKNTNEK